MGIGTIIAYGLTFTALYFSITSLPQLLFAGLIGRVVGPLLSALVGSIFAWLLVDTLWVIFEGGHIPLTALAGGLIILFGIGHFNKEGLNNNAKWMMAAEQWGITLVSIYIYIQSDVVRWY